MLVAAAMVEFCAYPVDRAAPDNRDGGHHRTLPVCIVSRRAAAYGACRMGQFSQLQDRRDLLQRRWHRAIRGHARDTRPTGTELLGHPHTDQHARWHQPEFYLSERSTEHVNIEQSRPTR